jgi:hypothetical protein
MTVSASDFALGDLLYHFPERAQAHHSTDVVDLHSPYVIKIQNHRIIFSAVNTGMRRQVIPDIFSRLLQSTLRARFDHRQDFCPISLIISCRAVFTPRLLTVRFSRTLTKVTKRLPLTAPEAQFYFRKAHLNIIADFKKACSRVLPRGIGPRTRALKVRSSATELRELA